MKKLTGLLMLAILGILTAFFVHRQAPGSAVAARQTAESSAGEERREVIVKHVFEVQPSPGGQAVAVPVAASPEPDPAAVPPEVLAQNVETAFASDPPAGEKARQEVAAITSAFKMPAARGAVLQQVECHATRCRMQIQFDDHDSDKRVISQIFDLLSSNGVDTHGLGFIIPTRTTDPDGKIEATIHLYPASASPGSV